MTEEIIIYSLDDEIIDIEWCFINRHTPPPGKKYLYKVDHEKYVTHHHEMTREQILEKAGKNPEHWILREKVHGTWVTIEEKQVVEFTRHGLEKFKTIKNEHKEGEAVETEKSLRRDFSLLPEDEEYLNSLGLFWEAIQLDKIQHILILDYPIPEGFNVTKAVVAVRMPPGYPTVQLDMLYFYPEISRRDGVPIGALSPAAIDGKSFQQWSRHRTPTNPWREGIDNLSTHIPLAEVWLRNEFIKNPSHALRA
jgi:hypothetical protein